VARASRRYTLELDPSALKVRMVSPAARQRKLLAGVHVQAATDAIAEFDRGVHLFGLTKGQFSMIDLAAAVLVRTGPADVSLWTWCIAEYEVEAITAFIVNQSIRRFRMVIDWTGAQRDMPLIADLQRRFGDDCVRVSKTHAKIVQAATEDGWRVTIRGSMNLNANPRFEQFDVSDDAVVFDVVEGVMAEMWERSAARPVHKLRHADAVDAMGGVAEGVERAGMPLPDWAPHGGGNWWK
jgi:hypothetical protein